MLPGLLLLAALHASSSSPPSSPPSSPLSSPSPRVFFAPLRVSADVDVATRQSIEGAVLVAAKRKGVVVIGAADVQALLDVEAAKQAAGCGSDSCAAELADALGAPQLLTGQVARLGDEWVLTLTHLEREHMQVLGRAQVSRRGENAGVLLADVEGATLEVLGKSASPVVTVGVVVGVSGAVVGAGAGAVVGYTVLRFNDGKAALADGRVDDAAAIRRDNEGVYNVALVGVGVGAAVAVVGAAIVVVGLISEEAP